MFRDLLHLGFRRPSLRLNSRVSSFLAAGDVLCGRTSRETSPTARSEEKRLFSQANVGQTDISQSFIKTKLQFIGVY